MLIQFPEFIKGRMRRSLGIAIRESNIPNATFVIWVLIPRYSLSGNYCDVRVLIDGAHEWAAVTGQLQDETYGTARLGIGDKKWSDAVEEDLVSEFHRAKDGYNERKGRIFAAFKDEILAHRQSALEMKQTVLANTPSPGVLEKDVFETVKGYFGLKPAQDVEQPFGVIM